MKKAVCVILCLLLAASLAGAGLLYAQTRRLRDENARLDAQAAERDTRIETLTAEAQASADSLAALSEQATEKDSELASLRAAVQVGRRPEYTGKNIAVIIPDNGMKYLSTPMYHNV